MRTIKEIKEILSGCKKVDSHIHTHLCDGKAEMTVENIAAVALEKEIDCVILTPHFHKRVSDFSETLYSDSKEDLFFALRDEIERYEREDGRIKFLLSTEADILSGGGDISLALSYEAEKQLDLVTPTVNYHPLLPLKFVHLTYGKDVNGLHESGEYRMAAESLGGIDRVLETYYQTQVNAIANCPYTSMLGHFFAAHSVHPDKYTWFGASEEHMEIMKDGARRVIAQCKKSNAMIDLTGVHLGKGETVDERMTKNGFLVDFQRFVVEECRRMNVSAYWGSDAHGLSHLGESHDYYLRMI